MWFFTGFAFYIAVHYGFDKHLYLTSCLNAHHHNTCKTIRKYSSNKSTNHAPRGCVQTLCRTNCFPEPTLTIPVTPSPRVSPCHALWWASPHLGSALWWAAAGFGSSPTFVQNRLYCAKNGTFHYYSRSPNTSTSWRCHGNHHNNRLKVMISVSIVTGKVFHCFCL